MLTKNKLSIIIILVLLSFLVVSCGQSSFGSSILKLTNKNGDVLFQPDTGDDGYGLAADESTGSGNDDGKEYLTCFTENPQPVAQDIADKFETSYEMVEDWYCQGHSFEDIMLALMTSRLWDIDPDQVFLAHETQTWDEIWDELDDTQ